MSSTISGLPPIATYLSIVKNEQAQVAEMVKTSASEQRTVSAFAKEAATITTPTALLSSKNQAALQVVLGSYNMSGQATETGLLKQLLTQDPTASNSLVRSSSNTDYLHFVQGMTARASITLSFGYAGFSSFTTGGSAASTVSMNNLGWGSADSALTSASPAKAWSYVLDDGTAQASVASALTTMVQSTGTTADPVTTSYSVDANGDLVGSAGAPPITTSTDSAGNTVYTVTLATDSSGKATRTASVVAVASPPAASGQTADTVNTATGTFLLSAALSATGFNVTANGTTGLTITNPGTDTALSLAPHAYSSYAGTTPAAITTSQSIIPLGPAGTGLSAGQVLLNDGTAIGTIASVDAAGNVTLTAPAAVAVSAGAQIDVAVGAGMNNIGTQITAQSSASTTSQTIALGPVGTVLQAGQILTDNGNVVGIVKSVDTLGNVTLNANAAVAVTAGDTIGVLPGVSDQQTPALADSTNTSAMLQSYETNQYEKQEGKQVPGLQSALYFTRTIGSITSINQLMSDTTLLKVVTTNLGIAANFGQLDYTQQYAILNSKVNLSQFSTSAGVQRYAEQFLALTGEQSFTSSSSNPAEILLNGGKSLSSNNSSDSDDSDGSGLLSVLYPGSTSSGGLLSILYPGDSSDSSDSTTSLLTLFT